MKEKIKKVYVSENGIEFETKLECVLYECNKKIGTNFAPASIHIMSKFIMDCKEEILKVLPEQEEVKDDDYIYLNIGDEIKEGDEFLDRSRSYFWFKTSELFVGERVSSNDTTYRRKKA